MAATLNTDLPLRLIGIQIFEETVQHLRKSLQAGWYPFIKCKEDIGTSKDKFPEVSDNVCPYRFYNIEEGLPRISISAIAGQNGSGKSSLLDILYRILNNFAYALFAEHPGADCKEVKLTRGLYARLYFEQDGVLHWISVEDDEVSYYELHDGVRSGPVLYSLNDSARSAILNRFFYTISVNYSIYSFNPKDYAAPLGTEGDTSTYDGEWLEYLFHKNDGYYIPLVLTPFRDQGEMNLANENVLAEQRISVLSLLYHSQKKEFLDGYEPYKLYYEFDYMYKYRKLEEFRKNCRQELRLCIDIMIKHFTEAWRKVFDEKEIVLDNDKDKENVILFYLAYKSLKICMTYPKYVEYFYLEDLLNLAEKEMEKQPIAMRNHYDDDPGVVHIGGFNQWLSEHKGIFNRMVRVINDDDSHVTVKIRQTLQYVQGERYKDEAENKIMANELVSKRYETYDEVLMLMPPSFYRTEMHYRKKGDRSAHPEEITLRTMSSGERQLLYSLSYICYHIKNIASNKKDGRRVVGYHHINLIFDEAELYYHPEFQRVFVKRLLERLAMCHINRTNIRSINIMIVTHSPFILSDIPETNVLYLGEKGSYDDRLTFGANIYDLLRDSFFLTSDIGEVAQTKIQEMIKLYNSKDSKGNKGRFEEKYKEFEYVKNHLGEMYLKQSYTSMFEELKVQYMLERRKKDISDRLKEIEQEREQLIAQLNNEGS